MEVVDWGGSDAACGYAKNSILSSLNGLDVRFRYIRSPGWGGVREHRSHKLLIKRCLRLLRMTVGRGGEYSHDVQAGLCPVVCFLDVLSEG